MPSVTKRRRRPGPRWIASTRMPFMLTAESLPRCQGIYPTILTERGLPAACTCRVVATGRVGADSARPGSSACRRRLPEQVACRRHWCPGPCRCPLLGWAGRDVGGKRPFPCCAADEVTSGGQFDPEVLECLACEVSFQVFFAFPQFGQNEPARVVEVGGEAVENAAVLPVRRGRRPACKLGNVVVCLGRRVKDQLYEDHEQRSFLAGCPVAVRPVAHSGVTFGWRTHRPGRGYLVAGVAAGRRGTQRAGTAAGWGGLPAGEELCQRRCEVFGGYPVPGAWQEARGRIRKCLGYSLGPVAQLAGAALAAGHEGGGGDGGEPVWWHGAGDEAVVDEGVRGGLQGGPQGALAHLGEHLGRHPDALQPVLVGFPAAAGDDEPGDLAADA